MGWLKKLIPGSKEKETKGIGALLPMPAYGRVNPDLLFSRNGNHYGVDWTAQLPQNVMQKIFEYVCPHTMDESYECNEDSAEDMGCMLCNMRDLSYCVLVCKRWRKFAVPVLYRSIRIDSVHYCALQDEIEAREARRDPALERMSLLCRTLRSDTLGLGACILILKTPYMIRESCKADLARICAVAPNLRYADLPQGFYACEASSMTLRTEVENRCPDIRKMSYNHGSEKVFENLATGQLWINLEVLELTNLEVDSQVLRNVLSVLENLRALKITAVNEFGDDLFEPSPHTGFLEFPPVSSLIIKDCPNVSIAGLKSYLSDPTVSTTLEILDINNTGIRPHDIHTILSGAKALSHLSIVETISDPFPKDQPPLLQSRSLIKFHYEIVPDSSKNIKAKPESYYKYLANSLLSNGLPKLQQLFVRDPTFPDLLINDLAPPMPSFMGDAPRPFAGRGTSGNRDSVASNFSAYGSPPSRSGFAGQLPSSPDQAPGFAPSSLSPPRAPFKEQSHARRMSKQLRLEQTSAMPQTQPNLAALAQQSRQQTPQGLRFPLEVFTKGLDEAEWNFSHVQPANPHDPRNRKASTSGARPISMVGMNANGSRMSGVFGSSAGVRSSIMVPNGLGGYIVKNDVEESKKFKKEGPEDEDAAFLRQMAGMGVQAPPKVSRGNVKVKKLGLF